jgi:hypothetical protein
MEKVLDEFAPPLCASLSISEQCWRSFEQALLLAERFLPQVPLAVYEGREDAYCCMRPAQQNLARNA